MEVSALMQKKGKQGKRTENTPNFSVSSHNVEIWNSIVTLRKYINTGVEHFKVLVLKYFPA